jgi:hypothetical protein
LPQALGDAFTDACLLTWSATWYAMHHDVMACHGYGLNMDIMDYGFGEFDMIGSSE